MDNSDVLSPRRPEPVEGSKGQTMKVESDFDIITARMRVRKLAQVMGLTTVDQARISLATSSLAQALGLGEAHLGQIAMDGLGEGERAGVRVVCTKADAAACDLLATAFDDMRWMVDELTVEKLPPNNVQITLVKWLAS